MIAISSKLETASPIVILKRWSRVIRIIVEE
jgi:hypothetical protein